MRHAVATLHIVEPRAAIRRYCCVWYESAGHVNACELNIPRHSKSQVSQITTERHVAEGKVVRSTKMVGMRLEEERMIRR